MSVQRTTLKKRCVHSPGGLERESWEKSRNRLGSGMSPTLPWPPPESTVAPMVLAEFRSRCPDHQRLAGARGDGCHAVQEEGWEGNDRAARSGRDTDAIADLELQIAALVLRRVGQLDAHRYFARLEVMRTMIDVPVIMAAFGAVIDRVLDVLQAGHVEVKNLAVEPAHHLDDAFVERRGLLIALQPRHARDSGFVVVGALDRERCLMQHHAVAVFLESIQFAGGKDVIPHHEGILHGASISAFYSLLCMARTRDFSISSS